ncbi:hypothetical protein [Sphaerisporangium fuscum]|uniref:hypothetical protein n=1 Tax=Sphaerisporangium fuscum TaxID=2835868 RepID=UPI001BDBE5EF|nr:hypothetical protein [Sphaerisporangium fuscum]
MTAASPGFVPDAPALPPARSEPARRVPVWQRILMAVLGLALVAGAVYAQTFVLGVDQLDDPITRSGGLHDEVNADLFSARLERVEFAKTVRVKKTYSSEDAATDQVFLVVKVGATAPRRPIQLAAHLLTADGLRFEPTDRVPSSATLAEKWVQPGWWRSGLYFFEVPPDKVAGARVVVSEPLSPLFGDQYIAEAAFDLGLDEAKARQMIGAAQDVYEVTG